ncbi:zinc-binding protein A33-like [Tachysurus vachellii]|uniref:zinc-binding protein A33-like n=1 Tax=Tachysurus vachellii TaxID=175792 RepID=UPI00296AB350|nr:zinc-binding protein A33-like [Tachysurus vachellii]
MAYSVYYTHDSKKLLYQASLLCSTCLEVFTDPVTTPCGHNFCKSCLTQFWNKCQVCCCPSCKEEFTKRPEVKINTSLSEIIEHFKKKNTLSETDVLCDICNVNKQKALKSCLDCGMTFCTSHLEPHSHVGKLLKHKLINPLKNLADYICQKHQRPLEMFCKDDQMFLCEFCVEVDHRNHTVSNIEDETGQRKTQLENSRKEVQHMIRDRLEKIQEIKNRVERCRINTVTENKDNIEVFSALVGYIHTSQSVLFGLSEKKQKLVENQAEELIKDLQQEITVLKRRASELEQILNNEDHLHLLKIYSSVHRPPSTKDWTHISLNTGLSVSSMWNALTNLWETLSKSLGDIDLRRIQLYAVDITLDPDTAHPNLILSCDQKQVRYGDTKQNLPDNPQRFTYFYMVLGKQGFSSGRFYFEVQVSRKTRWTLGVVSESANRKVDLMMAPENGFWTMAVRNGNECYVFEGTKILISQGKTPQKVGVFVDYEEGLVSFHDVEARCHIFSFTGQLFTGKLYPFINPGLDDNGNNSAPLVISSVL